MRWIWRRLGFLIALLGVVLKGAGLQMSGVRGFGETMAQEHADFEQVGKTLEQRVAALRAQAASGGSP